METILPTILDGSNQTFTIFLLFFACLRIYLELIDFPFERLPLTKNLLGENAKSFHRMGLIFSVGYILLFATQILLLN